MIIMIDATDKAKRILRRIFEENVDWPVALVRLIGKGQGKQELGVDIETQGDKIVPCAGFPVLIITPDLSTNRKQITIDVKDTTEGSDLVTVE